MSSGEFVNQVDDLIGNPMNEPGSASSVSDGLELEVDVVDDRPEDDRVIPRDPTRNVVDSGGEIEEVGGRAEKRINQLKYEYHEQRRGKEAAEKMREEAVRYAQQVANQNNELRQVLARGETVLRGEMQERAKGELEKARTNYKSAYEEGNTDNLLRAQEDLIRFQRQAEVSDTGSTIIPNHLQGDVTTPPQDPRLGEWMSRNDWFGKDQEMTSFAYGVHQSLVQGGTDPYSDEYYQKIDKRVREVFPARFGNEVVSEEPVANSRTSTVVASANRSSGKSRKVQLTSTQVALAKRLGLSKEQYARQVLKEMG